MRNELATKEELERRGGSLRESGEQVTDDRKSAGDDEFKVRQSTEKRENVNVKKMKVAPD